MRAGIYVRVSTTDQAVEGFSLEAQARACSAYAEAQGWTWAVYADEGISASKESADRPQFKRLLTDVEAKRVDVVVVHKLDRFSRQLLVTMQGLARISEAGAAFVSLSEHIDMSTPSGRLMLGMFALLAQFYADNLATEVSKGRAERARQGLWNGDLPFGYSSSGNPKAAPLLVPEEAALVRRAYELYTAGTWSAHQVAGWLNEQGARPRSKRGLTNFTKATVMDMLTNPFYTGVVRYKGEEHPGLHEPIVDPALFQRVEQMRHGRRKLSTATKEKPVHVYMLRGIARCSRCYRILVCSPGRGRRYRDASRDKHLDCTSTKQSVTASDAEQDLGQIIRLLKLPDDWRELILERVADQGDEIAIARRRQNAKDRMARLSSLYLDGDISKARYQAERVVLQAEIGRLDNLLVVQQGHVEESALLLNRLAEAWDDSTEQERAKIAHLLFEEVIVDMETAKVVAIKARPKFHPLFAILRDDTVLTGDPERSRVNPLTLYRPVISLVQTGEIRMVSRAVA